MNRKPRIGILSAATLAALLGAASTGWTAENVADLRVSESAFYSREGRGQATPDRVSTDTHESVPSGTRKTSPTRGRAQQKTASAAARTPNSDFWFYLADVELFADDDRDGYYHGIDLLFDADTIYAHADVYAVVYLSLEGGPWIEYAATENFSVYGATSDDEYVIVSELLSGYPRGSYDLLIELFDAWDDSFVADIGPDNTSELAFLPLEDAERDTPQIGPTPVVVNRGGGGAVLPSTLAALAFLVGVLLVSRRRQRMTAAARARCG
ncbi:MAG: choice-of-anchor H family protein [Woeseiaceae bacterium]|nr:choice-of-anchor H family protein [Woeseiaceae bacterium]